MSNLFERVSLINFRLHCGEEHKKFHKALLAELKRDGDSIEFRRLRRRYGFNLEWGLKNGLVGIRREDDQTEFQSVL